MTSTRTRDAWSPRPTFLFIGADRCGSKSLHQIFRQHPDCFVPAIADPYYFDKHYERGSAWYLDLFAGAPPTVRAIGEFSHDYIHSADAARRIAAELPDVQLIATLRHPIERTFSSYASAVNAGAIRGTFEQALKDVPMLIGNSLYADNLKAYYDRFPAERIKLLLFDDLEANTRSFAAQAFEFLDLPFVEEIDYDRRVSPLSQSRWPLAGAATKLGSRALRRLGWVNVLGRLKSNKAFNGLFYRPYAADERPKIAPETRRTLAERFASQIDWVEATLGRDLSHWRV